MEVIDEQKTPVQRRRLSKKSESQEVEVSPQTQAENDVCFGHEDTMKEIADAINDCVHDDEDEEVAAIYAVTKNGRRRSSVLRDKEMEAAAAALGDRMI